MTNIFDKAIKYITEIEVKDSTTKTWLASKTDAQIKIYISRANDVIDNYLGYVLDLNDEDVVTPDVLLDFKIACFYCVEQIYESWDLITPASFSSTWSGAISSERVWDRTVNFDVWTTITTTWNFEKLIWIPEQAKVILDKYRKIFFNQVL